MSARAAALINSGPAQGQRDFAVRAAACLALRHCRLTQPVGLESLWPGFIADFTITDRVSDLGLAAELLFIAAKQS